MKRKNTVPKPKWDNTINILLVEDEFIIHKMLKKGLEDANLTVTSAMNGTEAIDKTESNIFDVILMDYFMPYMNGIETAREIRERGIDTPIIGMTGADIVPRTEYENVGISDVIIKPLSFKKLFELLKKYIGDPDDTEMSNIKIEDSHLSFISHVKAIDINEAKMLFSGLDPEKNFITQLHNFSKKYANFKSVFNNELNKKNYKQCLIKVHNLKNVSNVIGAKVLANIASKLEYDFKNEIVTDNTQINIDLLFNILDDLLHDLITYVPSLDNIHTRSSIEVIKHLRSLVEEMDYKTIIYFEENEEQLSKEFGENFETLSYFIEKLDYEKALEIIQTILD